MRLKFFFLNTNIRIVIFFLSIFISINSIHIDFGNFNFNFINILNLLRVFLPILLFFIFFYQYYNLILSFKSIDIVMVLFLFYFLFQIPGIFLHKFDKVYYYNFIFYNIQDNPFYNYNFNDLFNRIVILIKSFLSIILFYTLLKFKKKIRYQNFYSIFIYLFLLSFSVFVYFSYSLTKDFFNSKYPNFYYLDIFAVTKNIINLPSIRSTGFARICLVLSIFFLCICLFYKFNRSKKIFFNLSYLFLLIFNFFIFMLQSRTSVYFLFLIYFFLFFLDNCNPYKIKIKILLASILIPFLFYCAVIKYRQFLYYETPASDLYQEDLYQDQSDLMINTDPFENSNRMMRTHTSGRVAIWKSSWNFINKRPYLGYGAAADRYLISENSSNIYIYSLLSSGFLGLAIIVTINLLVIYSIIKIIFFHKIFNKKGAILLKFSTLTILFLLLRSLVENSYSVFGLDLLIFLICYSLIRIFLDDTHLIYLKKL